MTVLPAPRGGRQQVFPAHIRRPAGPDVGSKRRPLDAGFLTEPKERVLAIAATPQALTAWSGSAPDIRRVLDDTGIQHVAEVSQDIGRDAAEDARRLSTALGETPSGVAAYVAYADGEPAACARIHFHPAARLAWLCGGRTKVAHRRRGFDVALVRHRIALAIERGCVALIVDALPTSEPILMRRGFRAVSEKQAFLLATHA